MKEWTSIYNGKLELLWLIGVHTSSILPGTHSFDMELSLPSAQAHFRAIFAVWHDVSCLSLLQTMPPLLFDLLHACESLGLLIVPGLLAVSASYEWPVMPEWTKCNPGVQNKSIIWKCPVTTPCIAWIGSWRSSCSMGNCNFGNHGFSVWLHYTAF